jgi:thioredoxin 1
MVLKGEDLGVPVEEVDIEANSDLARQYGIRSVPTMVFVRDGEEVSRITGAQSLDKIRDWVTLV